MGTPHYMSFEQLNSQRDIDARADVYAMGCVLYEALTGQLPYTADSAPALAIRMMSAPPVDVTTHRPDLQEELGEVVMKAIARERDERYQSMEALIEALRPFTSETGVTRTSGPMVAQLAATLPQLKIEGEPERTHKSKAGQAPSTLRWVGVASGAVLATLIGWWVLREPAPTPVAGSPAERQGNARVERPAPRPSEPRAVNEQGGSAPAIAAADPPKATTKRKRKVRRRKARPGALPSSASVAAPGEPDAVADEWEEVEIEEEVEEATPEVEPEAPSQPEAPPEAAGAEAAPLPPVPAPLPPTPEPATEVPAPLPSDVMPPAESAP
jgi:serine/threonine-protein kinase